MQIRLPVGITVMWGIKRGREQRLKHTRAGYSQLRLSAHHSRAPRRAIPRKVKHVPVREQLRYIAHKALGRQCVPPPEGVFPSST